MNFLKNFFSQWYKYVLWALMSVFFWGWIFTLHADARPAHKLVLCVDRPEVRDEAMAEALSRELPKGIRLAAVHPFDYYIFSTDELLNADLYIVGEDSAAKYIESFLPLGETGLDPAGRPVWSQDGVAYGLLICKAGGEGAAASYIDYLDASSPPQNYYLFFGVNSVHQSDGAQLWLAQRVLSLP